MASNTKGVELTRSGGLVMLMAGGAKCGGECAAYLVTVTLIYGGVGAGIGVGISAMTTSQHLIFAGTSAGHRNVTIAPIVDEHRKGAMLTVKW